MRTAGPLSSMNANRGQEMTNRNKFWHDGYLAKFYLQVLHDMEAGPSDHWLIPPRR